MDLHSEAAEARGIAAGDWVTIEPPKATVKARARFDATWPRTWSAANTAGGKPAPRSMYPGFPTFGPDTANFNLAIDQDEVDAVSGWSPCAPVSARSAAWSSASPPPELFAGFGSTLAQALQLGIADVLVDLAEAGEGGEAAVATGHHTLAADQIGEAQNAFGY